jgi:hypothetical protein
MFRFLLAENDFTIVRARARVVPLRAVNGKLRTSSMSTGHSQDCGSCPRGHIFSTALRLNEPVTLGRIEPLHSAAACFPPVRLALSLRLRGHDAKMVGHDDSKRCNHLPRLRPYPQIAPARPAWRFLQQWRGPCYSPHSVRKSNEFACLNAPFPGRPLGKALVSLVAPVMEGFNCTPDTRFYR